MLHGLLLFAHSIGLILMGAGLIGVFLADIRARQVRSLPLFAEAVRNIGLSYDGLVVPGAVLLAASGTGLIVALYGWDFLELPWLVGMVALFAFEFVEGNTVTRLYFMRLRRLTRRAEAEGGFTPELRAAVDAPVAAFTHFLDLPLLLVIVSLGVLRPDDWTTFAVGSACALTVAAALSVGLPRLYPREMLSPLTAADPAAADHG